MPGAWCWTRGLFVVAVAAMTVTSPLRAQQSLHRITVTREAAIASARATPRARVAVADSMLAAASLALARQYENPALGLNYTTDAPQGHITLDMPFDWPGRRSPRIAAAHALLDAATVRLTQARATIALETDTTYTRAQALEARSRLSARTARDADSLHTLARVRRDAGDASELDVELAAVFAGQSANIAAVDSANAVAATIQLQLLMGLSPDSVDVVLADTMSIEAVNAAAVLGQRAERVPLRTTATLPVAAALRDRDAAQLFERVERNRRFASPSLTLGVETFNPGGQGGLLPLVGIAIPLPLFNRNTASILTAQANVQRARATLEQVRLEQQAALGLAERDAVRARQRAERSVRLVTSAERIAAMSLLAYQEGAATLASVLEAQRSARDAVAQFTDDVAAMRIAERLLQFLLLGPPATSP